MAGRVDWKYLGKIAVFLVILFGVGALPPPAPLTAYGMKALGIFLALLFGWCAIDLIWTSIAGILAMVLLDIMSINVVFAKGWGSTVILLVFFMMLIAKNLEVAGVSDFIALFFISRKFVLGRPWVFVLAFLVTVYAISSMTSAIATILLCWGIFYSICKEISAKPYEDFTVYMITGVVIASTLGDGVFPFRTVGILVFGMMSQTTGLALNYFTYTLWSIFLGLCIIGGYVLLGKFLFKIDVKLLAALDADYFADKVFKLDKRQKTLLAFTGLLILFLLLPSITPAGWIFNQLFQKLNAVGIAAMFVTIMSVLRIGGAPLLDFRKIARIGTSWDVLFVAAAVLPLATGVLASEEAGLTAFLVKYLGPLVAGKPVVVFLIVVILLTTAITNFMINNVVGLLVFPTFYPFAVALGLSPVAMTCLIVYSCYLALLLPSASPMAAMLFGNSEWVRANQVYRYAIVFVVLSSLLLCILGIPTALLLF